tara:strand:+ start:616 stop:801 length:186 start_codon:yes stop_codon:yes gene_type:complete
MSDKIFWVDDFQGTAKGGYYFRAFDLVKFMKGVEEQEDTKVVGLSFEGNNVNVIIKKDEEK